MGLNNELGAIVRAAVPLQKHLHTVHSYDYEVQGLGAT